MPDIVLTTLNARYAHASFGLRYLMANLGAELQPRSRILEFEINNQRPIDVLETILSHNPRIVGVGVYIWNAVQSLQLVAELKRLRPDILIVLGGPEVSHETDKQEIVGLADYIITGEADLAFAELCGKLLANQRPLNKVIAADLPDMAKLALPYDLYDADDVAHRVIYVEASRGCPFKCEFCLSSLDVPVRNVPLDAFLAQMDRLFTRGVRQFKFVDRTFNLNLHIGRSILEFFLERYEPGLFLHFEMIPDRLPEALRDPIRRFPKGALQFEVGIQTFNEEVSKRISRKQDNAKLSENLRFLREETGVHVHADLIAGLPGEDLASFGAGFDRLIALGTQEIQVGILKRLRGTPIVRHDAEWAMVYSPNPPYEVMQTKSIDFATMQRVRRFSRFWDLIANSGNFIETTPMIWGEGSPFDEFTKLSDALHARFGTGRGISLQNLAEFLFDHLSFSLSPVPGGEDRGEGPSAKLRTSKTSPSPQPSPTSTGEREHASRKSLVARAMWRDYQRGGRMDCPEFLRAYVPEDERRAVRESDAEREIAPAAAGATWRRRDR